MSGLPRTRLPGPEDWERERLSRWLREWAIDQRLSARGDEEGAGEPVALFVQGRRRRAIAGAGGERRPMAGQIRLLYPEEAVTGTRLAFVAVLEETGGGFVVAPYSRFAEPAFEGEVLTGRHAACLRVLCLWNEVGLSEDRMERSWFAGEMSERERDEVRMLRDFLRRGAALPRKLAIRCGPPLRHPADPRAEYREQERAFAAELGRLPDADGGTPSTRGRWPEAEEGASGLMAAEPGERYGAGLSFTAPALGVFLNVTPLAGGDVCVLRVTDGAGRPGSSADGCRLQSRSGRMSRPIERGEALVPRDAIYGGFTLLTAEGETLAVRPGSGGGQVWGHGRGPS